MGAAVYIQEKIDRSLKLTTNLHLVQRLRINGVVCLSTLMYIHGMARDNVTFYTHTK